MGNKINPKLFNSLGNKGSETCREDMKRGAANESI